MFSLIRNRIILISTVAVVTMITLEFIKLKYNLRSSRNEITQLELKVESLTSKIKYNEKQCQSKITELQNEADFVTAQELINEITNGSDISSTVFDTNGVLSDLNASGVSEIEKNQRPESKPKSKPKIHQGFYKL